MFRLQLPSFVIDILSAGDGIQNGFARQLAPERSKENKSLHAKSRMQQAALIRYLAISYLATWRARLA